jgi:hypothetical protein
MILVVSSDLKHSPHMHMTNREEIRTRYLELQELRKVRENW